jgi:hypothetical protein
MIYVTKKHLTNRQTQLSRSPLIVSPLDMYVRCDVSGFVSGVVDAVATLENSASYIFIIKPTDALISQIYFG